MPTPIEALTFVVAAIAPATPASLVGRSLEAHTPDGVIGAVLAEQHDR